MKILLCHNYYIEPGGESLVFQNEIRGLRERGHKVITYTRNNLETIDYSIYNKATLPFSGFYSRRTQLDISHIVKQEKPEVSIVQNVFPLISPSIYRALGEAGVPIVQAVYNYRFICPNAHLYTQGEICQCCTKGNPLLAIVKRCYRDSYVLSGWYASILWLHRRLRTFARYVDIFMIPDEFFGERLIEGGIPRGKIRKNVNPFFVADYDAHYHSGNYILYAGRIVKQKGILTLVRSMALVRSDVQLLVVGDGEFRSEVERFVQRQGLKRRVEFLGTQWGEDFRNLVAEALCVVIPSEWYDNLPLILCQAYAMGKPVIASAINGIPEYVADGVDGLLFSPGDAEDLAEKIDYLTQQGELRQRMSRHARRKAETEFDYTRHYEVLLEIFDEVRRRN